ADFGTRRAFRLTFVGLQFLTPLAHERTQLQRRARSSQVIPFPANSVVNFHLRRRKVERHRISPSVTEFLPSNSQQVSTNSCREQWKTSFGTSVARQCLRRRERMAYLMLYGIP